MSVFEISFDAGMCLKMCRIFQLIYAKYIIIFCPGISISDGVKLPYPLLGLLPFFLKDKNI